MDRTQHDSSYSWTRLAISMALAIVSSCGIWAIVVVLPAIQSEFGISRADASIPYIATMAGFASGNFILGRFVDRYGITPVLILSGLISASGFAFSAMSPSFALVTALHFLLGLGASAGFGPLIADVSQWFLRFRGIAVAVAASGNYLAGAIWPPILAWAMASDGWRGAYTLVALTIVIVVLPGAFLLRRQIDSASTARATEVAAAKAQSIGLSPGTLQFLLAIAGIACCTAMAMPQVHIVALCIDRGFGAEVGAGMLSVMLVGGVASRLFFGALSDRLGGLKVLLISGFLQACALCLFLIQGEMATLFLISLIFGLSQGGIVPAYAVIVREYMPPQEAGRRVGIVMAATVLGMAFGGWASGWLYDQTGSYALAIWHGVAWNLVNVAITLGILLRLGSGRSGHPTPA